MIDMMLMAHACDMTRVGTVQWTDLWGPSCKTRPVTGRTTCLFCSPAVAVD